MNEASALLAFNRLFSRKSILISLIKHCSERYAAISNAIVQVLEDDYFLTLLRIEDLTGYPAHICENATDPPANSPRPMGSPKSQLPGVCSEAMEIFGDKSISKNTAIMLRRLKPTRQADAARLMDATGNYAEDFAMAIVMVTPNEFLVRPKIRKRRVGISQRKLQAMKRKMARLEGDAPLLKSDYGTKMLKLVFAEAYVRRLMEKPRIASYLKHHHPDQYQQMIASS